MVAVHSYARHSYIVNPPQVTNETPEQNSRHRRWRPGQWPGHRGRYIEEGALVVIADQLIAEATVTASAIGAKATAAAVDVSRN